jgi:hypothetical protein|tara:strand:- start:118 stop:684 length:567 start_codon:yes stop_codon:yes gene_type:complete
MSDNFKHSIKKENSLNLIFKNYKKLIYILVSILLILGISIVILTEINIRKNIKISEDFNQAKILLKNNKESEARDLLKNIINKKNKFYSPISLNLLIEKKLEDYESIIVYFDKILNMKKLNQETLDLYRLKKAYHISEKENENAILNILMPLIKNNSNFKKQAILFMENYYNSKGEKIKAKEFSKINK